MLNVDYKFIVENLDERTANPYNFSINTVFTPKTLQI